LIFRNISIVCFELELCISVGHWSAITVEHQVINMVHICRRNNSSPRIMRNVCGLEINHVLLLIYSVL